LVGTGEGGGTEDNDPFEASLTLVKRAGEAASIREHPKRTSTIKHIIDSALVVSIILVDPKMAGP
jgi:hypothetical protein